MIQSFKHKGIETFYRTGSKKGIDPAHAKKLSTILLALDYATNPQMMDAANFGLHPLKHWGVNLWAVKVSGNWRVTFRFDGAHALDVDYLDYH